MKVSKRLTSKSGVTIPKQMRAETGSRPGMGVDLTVTGQGVLITPHCPVCRFCGSPERVARVADIAAIVQAATKHKLYHTTYCNHLMTWVRRLENRNEIDAVAYGAELPADLAANLEEVLGVAQAG